MRQFKLLSLLSILLLTAAGAAACDDEAPSPVITNPGVDAGNNNPDDAGDNNSTNNSTNNTTNNNNPAPDAGDDVSENNNPAPDVGVDADEPWPFPWPEPLCTSDDDCEAGQGCIGGACADPVTASTYTIDSLGLVTDLYIPGSNDEPCCFDLNGDGSIDNTLSSLLALYERQIGGGPVIEGVKAVLAERSSALAIELRGFPEDGNGTVSIGLFGASTDLDSDGTTDFTEAQIQEGLAQALLDPFSFGPYGATLLYPAVGVTDFTVDSTAADFMEILLPFGERCPWSWHTAEPDANGIRCRSERPRSATFTRARLQGAFQRLEDGRLATTTEMVASGDSTIEVGSLKFGGYVHLDLVADVLNASYGDNCACIGVTPEQQIFRSTLRNNRYILECTPEFAEPDLSNCESFNRSCPGIADICDQLGLIGNLAEFDSDGDNIKDSVSFGLRATIAPTATNAGPPFIPARELCDTEADEDGDGRTSCDDPECWDDVNCGAPGYGERCHNTIDDDGDGLVDCDDPGCSANRACIQE